MQISSNNYPDLARMSQAAAVKICTMAAENIAQKGYFTLVLTGGRTPGLLYQNLAKKGPDKKINWAKTHIFWGDERCVPPEHSASNFKLAKDTLLDHIDIPAANIHRMRGENQSPPAAAREYEREIISFFKAHNTKITIPQFDLILLGMGEDGHIASIFPECHPEPAELITTTFPQNNTPALPRISMTLSLINNAECIMMLLSGPRKKEIHTEIMAGGNSPKKYPAAAISPTSQLIWEIAE